MMTRYKFRGYTITNCGYHQPDHCVWWEACDDDGQACFHGTTLREVEFMILDSEWEDKLKAKDREIAELRECLEEAITAKMIDGNCFGRGWKCDTCGRDCSANKWRKALKGANDEGK